ncbi:MAG: PHP domain-containing protein [Candidatus Omnitrophota bacterium]
MNSNVDLHVHTIYSDGTFTPEEVVRKAVEMDLKAIAITDHDCIDGILPTLEAAEGTGLEIIPGIEISAAKGDIEIHILGYFIDWQSPPFTEFLRKMQANRIERMRRIIELLGEKGMKIDADKVLGSISTGAIGRLHLARVMYEEGLVDQVKDAFDLYIGDGKPCHVRHKRLDYDKAISLIREAGGVPVLAHPGTMGEDEFIPDYIKAGLRGIEVYHSDHETPANNKYLKIAEDNGLIVTGGSDCHGMKKGRVLIGNIKIDYSVVEELREEAEKIRKSKNG